MFTINDHLKDSNGQFDITSTGYEFTVRGSTVKAVRFSRWQGSASGLTFVAHDADLAAQLRELAAEMRPKPYGWRPEWLADLEASLDTAEVRGYYRPPRRGETVSIEGVSWRCACTGHTVR